QDTVVFFGSARLREEGPLGRYYDEARELARRLTEWSMTLPGCCRFAVCSGGGGGIMEAANRGARDGGGQTIGLNIGLPREQRPNPYITEGLSFEFHYFFMRKLWFAYMARALVAFPGGFGTLDELTEFLTLSQTRKLERKLLILLYGSAYWQEVINFEALVRHGMIDRADLELFHFVDSPEQALALLQRQLPSTETHAGPHLARSSTPESMTE
ncbi:MAG TPA: TIGR00730 family Rossman fold protein, partial [Polyangiales bacterium]